MLDQCTSANRADTVPENVLNMKLVVCICLSRRKEGRGNTNLESHWRMQAGWQAWRRPAGQPGSITCKTLIHSPGFRSSIPIVTCSCSENSVRQIGQEESGNAAPNSLLWGGEIWEIWKIGRRKVERPGWRLLAWAAQSPAGPKLSPGPFFNMNLYFSRWFNFEGLSLGGFSFGSAEVHSTHFLKFLKRQAFFNVSKRQAFSPHAH